MNLYIFSLTCILSVSLKMIIYDGRDTHGQLWRGVRGELWKITRQAGTMTRLTGGMSNRPAGRATSNHTGLTTTLGQMRNVNIDFQNWSLNFMFCFKSPTYFQPWGHPTADKKHLHLSPPTGIDSTLRQDMARKEYLWKLNHKAVLYLTLSPRDEESIFHGEPLRPEQCVCCDFSHQLK